MFGIEVASQHAFGIPAARLDSRQSALLVTMLPDPDHRSAHRPGFGQQRLAANLQGRMAREHADTRCLRR